MRVVYLMRVVCLVRFMSGGRVDVLVSMEINSTGEETPPNGFNLLFSYFLHKLILR